MTGCSGALEAAETRKAGILQVLNKRRDKAEAH